MDERVSADRAREHLGGLARRLVAELPPRFQGAQLSPEGLASFYMLGELAGVPEYSRALAERLLDATVSHAVKALPWYARRYAEAGFTPDRPFRWELLPSLPVVARRDLEDPTFALRSDLLTYGFSTFTSGTTSQRPVIVDRSVEEQAFVAAFFAAMSPEPDGAPRPIALNLANLFHGRMIEVPNSFRRVPVSVNSVGGLSTASRLLQRTYITDGTTQRVSAVGGSLISLLRFTEYLDAEGQRAGLPNVAFVQCTSEYASPHTIRRLETFWGCPLEDRYGLSEIFVGAWRCRQCRAFHFEPYGIYELVGTAHGRPQAEGRGGLLLTGFYPFMQMAPLIRYATDDLVEVAPGGCPTGQAAVRLLGRRGRSLVWGDEVLLGEYEVFDLLDGEPEVYRSRLYRTLPDHLQEVGSPPVFELRPTEAGAGELVVALRYAPAQAPARVEALRRRLLDGFSPRQRAAVALRFVHAEDATA